jgi:hypothetical protein
MSTKTFDWDGETFELHEDASKWTLGETRHVERWLEADLNSMRQTEQMLALLAISIKRQRPTFRLKDAEEIPMSVVMDMVEAVSESADDEPEAGPTPQAVDVAVDEDVPVAAGSTRSRK